MLPLQLILDPSSLALSSMGETREEALRYIEELLAWDQLGSKVFGIAITSQETWGALFEDKELPDKDSLQQRLLECNIQEEHHAYDIIRLIDDIIKRSPYLEDVMPIPQEEKIIPINHDMHVHGPNMHRIFSRIIETLKCKDSTRGKQISVIAQKVVKEDIWSGEEHSAELTEDTALLLAGNYQEFLQHIDISKVLNFHPIDEDELIIALQLVYDRYTGASIPSDDIPHYRIGLRFITSIQSRNATPDTIRKLLTTMVETLLEVNQRKAHLLRKNKSGGSSARKRTTDGAAAWRRDIDRDYHLHYWKGDKGFVEFAWLSYPHDDFECPE